MFRELLKRCPQVMESYYAPLVADYTSDYYKGCCDAWTAYCNEVCEPLSGARQERLIALFRAASEHELYFWEMAGNEHD